jgi:hypothetical protein
MKKIIIALLAGIILLSLVSCADEETDQNYSIKDALKISAWVLDESIEGDVDRGMDWITESTGYPVDLVDGVICDDIYALERLNLNKVRKLAPLNRYGQNLNILFEFDGIIEVEVSDDYLQLSYNGNNPSQFEPSTNNFYASFKVPREVYVNVCPLAQYYDLSDRKANVRSYARIGSEYYLYVNAYKFDNEETPVIRAKLKLVVLEDKTKQPDSFGIEGEDSEYDKVPYKERSRFLSIEVVSYEYSDMYRLLDEIVDDEDDE